MTNKTCPNCANYCMGKLAFHGPDIPRSCSVGNTVAFDMWWEVNGRKKSTDNQTQMDCFVETEWSKIFNSISLSLDELKQVIEYHKDNKT